MLGIWEPQTLQQAHCIGHSVVRLPKTRNQVSKELLGLLEHGWHCHTAVPVLATTTREPKFSIIRSSTAFQTLHIISLCTLGVNTVHICYAW